MEKPVSSTHLSRNQLSGTLFDLVNKMSKCKLLTLLYILNFFRVRLTVWVKLTVYRTLPDYSHLDSNNNYLITGPT